jgi:hypothetical protein
MTTKSKRVKVDERDGFLPLTSVHVIFFSIYMGTCREFVGTIAIHHKHGYVLPVPIRANLAYPFDSSEELGGDGFYLKYGAEVFKDIFYCCFNNLDETVAAITAAVENSLPINERLNFVD